MENINFYVKIFILSIVFLYSLTYFDTSYKKGGKLSKTFQRMKFWKILTNYFRGEISVESELDPNQLYIFCNFPHGACTWNHFLTMTDGCEMLSKIYPSERRDLAASILLLLGCVDAGQKTAHFNLQRKRSLLIFIGGEKEQLLTTPRENKIVLKSRKGFVKLALQYGAHLVPMYAYGENECYSVSKMFMGFRLWLQRSLQLGLPIVWGVWGSPVPYPVQIAIEIGSPISVIPLSPSELADPAILSPKIEELHKKFCQEMIRLFERTKKQHGFGDQDKLEII